MPDLTERARAEHTTPSLGLTVHWLGLAQRARWQCSAGPSTRLTVQPRALGAWLLGAPSALLLTDRDQARSDSPSALGGWLTLLLVKGWEVEVQETE
jgi:hypothetical protein